MAERHGGQVCGTPLDATHGYFCNRPIGHGGGHRWTEPERDGETLSDEQLVERALQFVAQFNGDARCSLNCKHAEAVAAEIHRLRAECARLRADADSSRRALDVAVDQCRSICDDGSSPFAVHCANLVLRAAARAAVSAPQEQEDRNG